MEIWTYSESSILHQIFQSELFDGLRFSPLAQIAPTAESMVSAVASDPGALGYVLRSWITDGVTSIQIESDSDLALQQPILVLTNTEPQGGLRALMACLQSGIGQSALLERYSPMK
jgi:ABC-type phosphate transport system substrate-binding protein